MKMKKLLIIAVIFVFGCQPAAPPCECGITGQDKVSIRDQEQEYVRGVFEKDLDRATAILSDDIVAMPPNSPEIHGIGAYRQMISEIPELLEFEFLEVEIEGGNDIAFAKGNYVMVMEVDGKEIGDEGSFVEIWKKDDEGVWKMHREIWNSGTPLVTADTTIIGN